MPTKTSAFVLVVLILGFALAGCGSAEKHEESVPAPSAAHIAETEHAEAAAKTATAKAAPPTPTESYTGLGSRSAAFVSQHPGEPPNPSAVHGINWFTILSTNHQGRVTAFRMNENDEPPEESRERISFARNSELPSDAEIIEPNTETCIVWRSGILRKLIGDEYAAASTIEGSASAELRAEPSPSC
jgi:hypothetical protein